ncbi:MAG: helix-turn-helix transcriptional regulator [Bacteroidota bacterium]
MTIERLKILLSHFRLAPSAFADTIGVPRSSISHLLSGRNKPSLDFVLKLVNKFPEVDLYWLLQGKGKFPSAKEVSNKVEAEIESSNGSPTPSISSPSSFKDSKISKIAVFYEDGTFETFQPKN